MMYLSIRYNWYVTLKVWSFISGDATNRVIADRLIGRDAKEIVDILNERAGYIPNPLYVDEYGNG